MKQGEYGTRNSGLPELRQLNYLPQVG